MNQAHLQIIDFWDSPNQLAADIGRKPSCVRKWRQRQIPFEHWPAIIAAAKKRGKAVTPEMFLGIQPVPSGNDNRSRATA